jgi:hypothetical protein
MIWHGRCGLFLRCICYGNVTRLGWVGREVEGGSGAASLSFTSRGAGAVCGE